MSDETRIQRLPAPPDGTRVETGPVQFGDDGPGLFVRGDNAHDLMSRIERLAKLLAGNADPAIADALTHLTQLADLIDRGVLLPPPERWAIQMPPVPPSKEEAEARLRAIAAARGTLGKSTIENLEGSGKNLWDSDEDLDQFLAGIRARRRDCDGNCHKE